MKSTFLTLRLFIFGVHAVLGYGAKCGPSDYLSAAGECCPVCNIGSVVLRDCHGENSTTCKPCSGGTFMNELNGLQKCFRCKSCDTGLYNLQKCTTIKNTVCGVLDGYYCMDYSDGECSLAMKHSDCKPGEQIKTPGTKASDAVCEPCAPGFYSPEGLNCTKWTDCSVSNKIEDQEGTSISDVKCKLRRRERYGVIAAAVAFTIAVILLSGRRRLKRPVQETNPQNSEYAPSLKKGATPIF